MSSNGWRKTIWGELATLEYGKSLRDYDKSIGEIPVYGTNGQIGFTDKPLCPFPSVIIGRKGAYRGVHYSSRPFFVIDTAFYLKPKVSDLDLKFAYYQLLTQDINSMDSGSAIPSTSREDFYNLQINLPPLRTQRRIASILSSLDDKIELNRQTNATLEAVAQAIFKEWFVDFRFPGATGEMQESELGLIPKGWRIDSILSIAQLLSGGTPSTKKTEYWGGEIKWVSAKDVSNANGTFIINTERSITQEGIENSNAKILPRHTTIVTARGTVGNYAILSEPMAINQTNYGLKGKEKNIDFFVFFSLANLVAQLKQASYGTIFDTVTTNTFETSKVRIPPIELIQKFENYIDPIMRMILNNLVEIDSLAQIRDSLLPKLMTGEIEV